MGSLPVASSGIYDASGGDVGWVSLALFCFIALCYPLCLFMIARVLTEKLAWDGISSLKSDSADESSNKSDKA